MRAFIVKTNDGYLYPFDDDASVTDSEEYAGLFDSTSEARSTAQRLGYLEGSYKVLSVESRSAHAI